MHSHLHLLLIVTALQHIKIRKELPLRAKQRNKGILHKYRPQVLFC